MQRIVQLNNSTPNRKKKSGSKGGEYTKTQLPATWIAWQGHPAKDPRRIQIRGKWEIWEEPGPWPRSPESIRNSPFLCFLLPLCLPKPKVMQAQLESCEAKRTSTVWRKEGPLKLALQLGPGYIVLIMPGRPEPGREILLQLAFWELS